MKSIKIIFIALEIAALVSTICLAFIEVESDEAELFKSWFLAVLPCFAVAMQQEQQSIDWDEESEEAV